jgi:uncharacterized protein (DUF1015 family)
LVILPTHRVVFGLQDFSPEKFLAGAAQHFQVEELENLEAPDVQKRLANEGASRTAFVAVTQTGHFLLKLKPDATDGAPQALSPRQRQLDMVRLHSLVLEQLLGITAEAIRQERNLHYFRDAGEAIEQVTEGSADLALLVNPTSLDQLREIAFAGEVMPQKSTDFYPKLLSGLAIYALD